MALSNTSSFSGTRTNELLQELYELEKDAIYPTEKEKEEFLAEFYEAARTAKEKEHSFANRMLSGITMAATGIGGQMMATAISEQSADKDAEMAMKSYLATFTCKYGDKHANGGEVDIELPGGNDLINLYSEYIAIANDLKTLKSSLEMKPGIESEPILDAATSGLYDDINTGKTSGVYASLARALQDPNSEDAKLWTEQKKKSEQNLKTGAIITGTGTAIGITGNTLINHVDKDKKNSSAIKKKTVGKRR